MKELFDYLKIPSEPFETDGNNVWSEPRMARFVLASHLDANLDGASRDSQFIDESVKFIEGVAPPSEYRKVIDLGCGPGLYAQRLAKKEYDVTGIDISENSIRYAKEQAQQADLNIAYRCENLFDFNEENKYDLGLLIYQIYCMFSPDQRRILLENVHRSLKRGGILIMDVLSEQRFNQFQEEQHWSFSRKDNLVSDDKFLLMSSTCKYPDNVTLQKSTFLFAEDEPINLYYWNQHFRSETLQKETEAVGFATKGIYADVNGERFTDESETIAVVLEKI
jgi:SAM-dependent methyltransferase